MKPDPVQSSNPDRRSRGAIPFRFSAFRYSGVELLLALGLLFLVTPFVEELPRGQLVESILLTVVMISAVLAVGGRRRTLIIALLLLGPAVLAKWINHLKPEIIPPELFMGVSVVFFLFVIAQLLRFILLAPRVDANVLCAGISGFLMLGLLWMPAYLLVAQMSPGAFVMGHGASPGETLDGFNAFYFSFITLCTVGYGDVAPVTKVARMLTVLEAITGLFYMAVLMSRLVAVYSASTRPPADDPPPHGAT